MWHNDRVPPSKEEIMVFTSADEALTILNDTHGYEVNRVLAAQYLARHPTLPVVESLIKRLEDDDVGVRWAAAEALAALGKSAVPPLLHALKNYPGSARLRSGILYVFAHNSNWAVRQKEAQLRHALTGPAGGYSAMRAAKDILQEMHTP
jgi:HEAT repeat protein